MFEWLEEEIRSIKTPHFHEVDGPAPPELRQAVEQSGVPIPPSYKEFIFRFGNAKLYRCSSWYRVQVYAAPREEESEKGERLLNFGRPESGLAYFKEALLVPGSESPVFEWNGPEFGWRRATSGFEEWIVKKCRAARRRIKKKEWASILEGPNPFTEQEQAIVDARKHFRWRVIGIADNGDLQFEIYNGSTMVLPYLTVGLRHKRDKSRIGGVKLPLADLRPGQTKVAAMNCYKDHYDPSQIEPFDEPDPEPALRDLYWEFRAIE